jgi:hypothetical protein
VETAHGQEPRGFRGDFLFWRQSSNWTENRLERLRCKTERQKENGRRPMHPLFRWTGSYEKAEDSDNPAERTWHQYLAKRSDLWPVEPSGEPLRPDDKKPGYINPNMPMPKDQWPENYGGEGPYTWADWQAQRLASFAEVSGNRGVNLADWSDSMPHGNTNHIDFHPRLIKDFERRTGIEIAGEPVSERAEAIQSNHFVEWTT